MDMDIGCRVFIKHLQCEGTVRYLGPVHYAGGAWAGVELDDFLGKNDGSVKGKRYFDCEEKKGVFAKQDALQVVGNQGGPSDVKDVANAKENANPSGNAEEIKRAGNEAFVAQNFEAAEKLYTQAIALDSRNHILFGNRAACHLALDDPESALEDAERAVKIDKKWWKGHARKGKALAQLELFEEAIDSLETAIMLAKDKHVAAELGAVIEECQSKLDEYEMEESGFGGFGGMDMEAMLANMSPEDLENEEFLAMMMMQQQMMGQEGSMDMMNAFGKGAMPPIAPSEPEAPKMRLKKIAMVELALHSAVKDGDLEELRNALEQEKLDKGFDINELDDHGRSALAWACQMGRSDMVNLLIENGASVNPLPSPKKSTDDEDEDVAIPLFFAVKSGSLEVVKALLEAGADLNVTEPILGHTIVHQAVKTGNLEMFQFVLKTASPELLNKEDLRGISAFGLACRVRLEDPSIRKQMLKMFVDSGASIDAGVLFAALTSSDQDSLVPYLQSLQPSAVVNASPSLRTSKGATLLHLAAKMSKESEAIEMLEKFFKAGLKPLVNEVDSEGFSPLGYVCRSRPYRTVIDILVKNGADVNQSQGETTLLHMVGEESHEASWEQLISLGADPQRLDASGKPPKLRPNLGDKCVVM